MGEGRNLLLTNLRTHLLTISVERHSHDSLGINSFTFIILIYSSPKSLNWKKMMPDILGCLSASVKINFPQSWGINQFVNTNNTEIIFLGTFRIWKASAELPSSSPLTTG